MSKRYNTPHRTRTIKTRMTEEEHADFMERLNAYGMSQSEYPAGHPGRDCQADHQRIVHQ